MILKLKSRKPGLVLTSKKALEKGYDARGSTLLESEGVSKHHPGPGTGMPEFEPTPEQREVVKALVAFGIPQDRICLKVINPRTGEPITKPTLEKHFAMEIALAVHDLVGDAGQVVYNLMSSPGPAQLEAARFILSRRGGEAWIGKHRVEQTGKGGSPIEIDSTNLNANANEALLNDDGTPNERGAIRLIQILNSARERRSRKEKVPTSS